MLTLEKIGWIAVIIGLILGVTTAIVRPIYNKAKDQGEELEGVKFDVAYHYEIDLSERNQKLQELYYGNTRTA